MRKEQYHYTECGLDTVFLVGGFEYRDTPQGRTVIIKDVDGLQRTIGFALARKRTRLTGKEFRFLRSELLLSQAHLAEVLGVKELTIGRWERGETEIPLSAEAVVRAMFMESAGRKRSPIRQILDRIADLDDELDRMLTFDNTEGEWRVVDPKVAA